MHIMHVIGNQNEILSLSCSSLVLNFYLSFMNQNYAATYVFKFKSIITVVVETELSQSKLIYHVIVVTLGSKGLVGFFNYIFNMNSFILVFSA